MSMMALEYARRTYPEHRLHGWEQTARPLRELASVDLPRVGVEISRSVLVDPTQPSEGIDALVERLLSAPVTTPEQCLPLADAYNALQCIGVVLPERAHVAVRSWLPALTAVEPPFPGRIRAGLAALAFGDLRRAGYVALEPAGELVGGRDFPNDLLSLVGYARAVMRNGGTRAALDRALDRVVYDLDELCTAGQLDEATVLWLARLAYHRLDGQPLASVAVRAREWLWSTARRFEHARQASATAQRPFPLDRTLGGGVYRVDDWLRGEGSQRLYRGSDVASGRSVLIAIDAHSPRRQSVSELNAAVGGQTPGTFDLAYVGTFDDDRDHWAIVEAVPDGDWLPSIVGAADPWSAPRKALDLAVSAGEILERAAAAGSVLAEIRPELMWGALHDGHYRVTALSCRAIELFNRARGDSFSLPLFDRWYRAPEAAAVRDDRAVTFALGVMAAEWATGRYPLRSAFGREMAERDPIELPLCAPPTLRDALEAALRPDPRDRPRLSVFVDSLRTIGALSPRTPVGE